MTESRGFCPECGETVAERAEPRPGAPRADSDALCDRCYFDEFDFIDAPERVQVTVCGRCGAIHRGNRWVDVGAVDYTDIAIDAVSESLSVHTRRRSGCTAPFRGLFVRRCLRKN